MKISLRLLLICLLTGLVVLGSSLSAASPKYTLVYASEDNAEYPPTKGINEFARYVEEKSKGAITVKIHLNGTLGDERAQVESTMNGTIDLGRPALNRVAFWEKDWEVWTLPYLVTDFDAGVKLMRGRTYKKMVEDLRKTHNIRVLAVYGQGFRCVANNKRPINSIADLRGLKMRVSPTPLFVRAYELMGAQPVAMPFGEVFSALKQGVVDGYENDPASHVANKFNEVTKYFAVTNSLFYNGLLIMNEKKFRSMPAAYQRIILEASKRAEDTALQATLSLTNSAIDKMKQSGTVVTYPDLKPFRDAVKPIYDEYRAKLSPGLMDAVLKEAAALAK